MNTAIEIDLLTEADFSCYGDEWNSLLEESGSSSYFLKWEWLYSFWETQLLTYPKSCELRVYTFKAGTKLVGILPLYLFKSSLNEISVRKIHFLGNDVASDHMDIICLHGYHGACCDLFYNEIMLKRKNEFDKIELQSIDKDSYLLNYLKEKEVAHVLYEVICPRVILPDSYDEYLGRYNSKKRNQIKNRSKKIHKDFKSVEVEFHSTNGKIDLLDTLFDLHKKRSDVVRKGRSTFYNDYRKRFNTHFFNNCKDGSVLFSLVKLDGKIVSMLYMFIYKGNLHYYQSGWSPEYSDYSISFFHLYEVIKYAIEKGYTVFDMLRGDEPYKNRLKGVKEKTYTYICFSPSFMGLFHRCFFSFFKGTKTVIKRCLTMVQLY